MGLTWTSWGWVRRGVSTVSIEPFGLKLVNPCFIHCHKTFEKCHRICLKKGQVFGGHDVSLAFVFCCQHSWDPSTWDLVHVKYNSYDVSNAFLRYTHSLSNVAFCHTPVCHDDILDCSDVFLRTGRYWSSIARCCPAWIPPPTFSQWNRKGNPPLMFPSCHYGSPVHSCPFSAGIGWPHACSLYPFFKMCTPWTLQTPICETKNILINHINSCEKQPTTVPRIYQNFKFQELHAIVTCTVNHYIHRRLISLVIGRSQWLCASQLNLE